MLPVRERTSPVSFGPGHCRAMFANRSLAGTIFPHQTSCASLGTRFAGDQPACETRLCDFPKASSSTGRQESGPR